MSDEPPPNTSGPNESGKDREDEIRKLLADFFAFNPAAGLRILKDTALVTRAWAEEAIEIKAPHEKGLLEEALNSVILPDRYSGIWHRDTGDLELIFTAYRISPGFEEFNTRKFDFSFDGASYPCEFTASSARLIAIARDFRVADTSQTQWRNLSSYQSYARLIDQGVDTSAKFNPISFWIRGIDVREEDKTLSLVTHLNFYMVYFDSISSRVLIHSNFPGGAGFSKHLRFPHGDFPSSITGVKLDEILWQFWDASLTGDAFRRFLYNYQIIEYAAEYYVDEEVKRSVKRLLVAPNFSSNVDSTVALLIDMLAPKKGHDIQKRMALLKNCVDPGVIWAELQYNREAFEKKIEFDGGFTVDPFLVKDTKYATFANNWAQSFEGAIRNIRNGLSHGRESSTVGVIAPTIANQSKLWPWLGPLAIAAREVMLYRGIT